MRIFPLYYLGLPLTFFVVAPGGAHPLDRLWYLFSAQNWVKIDVFFAGHYWSLAVKEQFYLLWPFVVRRFNHRQVLKIAIAGSVLALMLRLALLAANVDPYYIYRNVFARMDALLIGPACACLMREESVVKALYRYAKWLWRASLGIFGILKLSSNAVGVHVPATQRYGYTLIALGYGSLLLAAILTMGSQSLFQGSSPAGSCGSSEN